MQSIRVVGLVLREKITFYNESSWQFSPTIFVRFMKFRVLQPLKKGKILVQSIRSVGLEILDKMSFFSENFTFEIEGIVQSVRPVGLEIRDEMSFFRRCSTLHI